MPPKKDGRAVQVECELQLNSINGLKNEGTAHLSFNLKMYWEDWRLVQYLDASLAHDPRSRPPLPADLWRPGCLAPTLENKRFFVEPDTHADADVQIVDAGRGMLCVESAFNGLVQHDATSFEQFPFDESSITMRFGSTVLRDGRLTHTVTRNDGTHEPCDVEFAPHSDAPVTLLSSDKLPEFRLVGSWHAFENRGNGSYLFVGLVVRRRWKFYMYNILIPQWTLLVITSMSTGLDASTEFADRATFISTMYLVSVAIQWLIAELLPKTEDRTALDHLVMLTSLTIFALLLVATTISMLHEIDQLDPHALRKADFFVSGAVCLGYVVCTLLVLLPRLGRYNDATFDQQPFPGTIPANAPKITHFRGLKTSEVGRTSKLVTASEPQNLVSFLDKKDQDTSYIKLNEA